MNRGVVIGQGLLRICPEQNGKSVKIGRMEDRLPRNIIFLTNKGL